MIPLPYRVFGQVFIVVLIAAISYYKGREHGLERYYAFKSEVASVLQEAKVAAAKRQAEQERTTREIVEGWSAAVDWLRSNPRVVRVREPADRCSSGVSSVSSSAGQFDAAPAESKPGAGESETTYVSPEECELIITRAVVDAAQLLWLQHWIREQQNGGLGRR